MGFLVEDKGLKAVDNIDSNTKLSVEDNGGHKGTKLLDLGLINVLQISEIMSLSIFSLFSSLQLTFSIHFLDFFFSFTKL